MEEQEKNVKRKKQESATVRSDRSRIYLQRSHFEKI